METKTKTDISKYIVNVQGKDFITFPGLLAEAHALGLSKVDTTMVNNDFSNPVMKAVVTLTDTDGKYSEFTGYGDANESNVAPQVRKALIRMAETRAIARALRFACNIDMAALEELDAETNVISNKPKITKTNTNAKTTATKTSSTVLSKPTIKTEKKLDFKREPDFQS